jgi:hypothetical protein
MHYGGMVSNHYKGFLLAPEIDIGTDGITIRVRAVGMTFGHTKQHKKRVIKELTQEGIIRDLLDDGKDFNIFIDPNDAAAKKALGKIHSLNAVDSNWAHTRSILDAANCIMFDRGSKSPDDIPTMEIVSKEYLRQRNDNHFQFILWEQIDPNANRFPILELKTSIANYIMGQNLGQANKTVGADKKLKDTKEPTATLISTVSDKSVTGKPGALDKKTGDLSVDAKPVTAANERDKAPSLIDKALGLAQKAMDKALQYEITTVGIMELTPGRTVTVNVAGVSFLSGQYDLYTVEHNFSLDGVTTSLTLARTFGLAVAVRETAEKANAILTKQNGKLVATASQKGLAAPGK